MKRQHAGVSPLSVLRDLMLGGRHARRTVERMGVSLPTADRWLHDLARHIPGLVATRNGRVTWYEWRPRIVQRDAAPDTDVVARMWRQTCALAQEPCEFENDPPCFGCRTCYARETVLIRARQADGQSGRRSERKDR